MKATGIVRRIDERGIITPKIIHSRSEVNHSVLCFTLYYLSWLEQP